MEKGGGGARAPGCPCAAWPPRPHPGRVRLSSCSSEVQTGPAGGGALGGERRLSSRLLVHCLPLHPQWAWLGTRDLGRSPACAGHLPHLVWSPQKMPSLRRSGMLWEREEVPLSQLAKPRSRRGAGLLDHSPEGWRPWGGGRGPWVSPPGSPGHTGWKPCQESGPTGPRPCQRAPRLSPPPGRTGEKHVTQGLAPRSFSLTSPCHPTPGREPIGCARASGRGLSGSVPQLPLGLRWLPCPSPLGGKPAQLLRLPDSDMHMGHRAVNSRAGRFTSRLGLHICQLGKPAQPSC